MDSCGGRCHDCSVMPRSRGGRRRPGRKQTSKQANDDAPWWKKLPAPLFGGAVLAAVIAGAVAIYNNHTQRHQQDVVALRKTLTTSATKLTNATFAVDALRDRCQD